MRTFTYVIQQYETKSLANVILILICVSRLKMILINNVFITTIPQKFFYAFIKVHLTTLREKVYGLLVRFLRNFNSHLDGPITVVT